MPSFGEQSMARLRTAHPMLRALFCEVVKHFDCTILCGVRDQAEQDRLFEEGKSRVLFPNSSHNSNPSMAVDVAPWPVDWTDTERFIYFGGYVKGVAMRMGVPIRWGGDWDGDFQVRDNRFNDLVHFELLKD